MTLGDRVAVLKDGLLQQCAPPMELYRRPANRFVGGFIGSPAMNDLEGVLREESGTWRFVSHAIEAPVDPPDAAADGRAVALGIRPPDVRIAEDGAVPATVEVVEPIGSQQIVHCAVGDDERIVTVEPIDVEVTEQREVHLTLPREAIHLFDVGTGERLKAR